MNRDYKGNYKKTAGIVVILISLCSLLFTTISFAEQNSSIDNAVQEIRNQTRGKIISADTVTIDGVLQHRIKVLMPNGHVKVFYRPVNN
ncbi:MAG: hypothetical protein ACC657_10345 [Thiohalomonadales bacterium]